MATDKMEMKENSKHKTWKMSPSSEPSLTSDPEVSSLKRFTIPKIRKTTEEVYLSPCCTNTREYSFIQSTLKQCRLDVSCDLQLTWQFGDTKLIRNKDLERKFTAKRSEMREGGRHGRELEENFCFLVPPQSDVVEIYQHGMSTGASALKILGNPLLGVYIFRHVDVALNYAHSQSITVQSIMIFKVLFGKVKKIQPCVDKNKVSLDPSPNFDCHMSRNTPSLKDVIELQAYNSAVYAYEYDVFSKPVDKPRQCLPYAIVTAKFIGQKSGNGHLMTSLRFPSTGFHKRFERTCSLNNCTVAKRIGKGKDATVIFEHFRKPVNPYVENCSCKVLDSEKNPYNSNMSNAHGNVQNGNFSILEACSRQTDNSSTEIRDASRAHGNNPDLSLMPSENKEMDNSDLLLNLTYLKSILSNISAAYPSHNNTGSSTVITSKLIKDPRLIRREQSMGKQNSMSPFDKNLNHVNSEINLTSLPTNSIASSAVVPGNHAVLTNRSVAPSFNFSFEDSQFQAHNMNTKDCDCVAANKTAVTGQWKEQCRSAFPISLSNVVSEVENQEHSEEKAKSVQKRSDIQFLTKQSREPHNVYKPVSACSKESMSHVSQKSQSSNLKAVYEISHQMSIISPLQKKGNMNAYVDNIGKTRACIDSEDHSKHGVNQNWWKETDDYFTIETRVSPVDNCNTLHQEYKEGRHLNSLGKNYEKILMTQELQVAKSTISATKDKDALNHAALKLQHDTTPGVECFSKNDPRHSPEYEGSIHTSLAINQKLMELNSQNCVSMTGDAFQEAEDIPRSKEVLIDRVISSSDIELSLDNSNCHITRGYMCVQRKTENDPLLLEKIQKNYKETPHIEEDPDDILFSSTKLNISNTNFKGQRDHESPNETKEEDSTSSPEYNIENTYRSEKQNFPTDSMADNVVESGENENHNKVEILSPEELSKLNLIWGEKDTPTDSVTAIKQRDAQSDGGSTEHLASMTSKATEQVASTAKPTLNTNHEDDQQYYFKENCSSESSDFSCVQHRVSDYEINMDKNKLQYSFHPSINENSGLENCELGSEAEIEECGDTFVFQDTHSHENVLCEEFELYEVLKSRIDWEGLFGSSNREREPLRSSPKGENSDQHPSAENDLLYSSAQKNKSELLNPVLLPDLQVTITDVPGPGFSLTDDTFSLKDLYKFITESSKPEINEEKPQGFGFFFQPSGENSSFPCEGKLHMEESRLVSESDLSHNIPENTISEKPSAESLSANLPTVTVINEKKCSSTVSKTGFNDTKNKKDMESRINKRRLHTSPRDQEIPHKDRRQHETSERRKKVTSRDSSECFSSLSQGRMKTFSQSERHIRSVLDILNSEASLCKSRRLSRKLDRAVLHLKKAHRRVNTSLQIVSKVGKKRKGPLPKAYAITCNNFWESCDLQGSVSERRYSKHFLSKRKYGKQGEKRILRFDINESLAQVSKHRSYRTNSQRITEGLPNEIMCGSVSKSLATSHVREYCDEQYPESQLPLTYTCHNTGQSEDSNSNTSSPAPEHSSEISECMLYPDETLTEKEYRIDTKLSNSEYAKLENHSTYDIEHLASVTSKATEQVASTAKPTLSTHHEDDQQYYFKENSEANALINESNSESFSCIEEYNGSHSTDNDNTAHKAHTGMTDSDLDSNTRHVLNANIYKQDDLIISGCKRNLEMIFPIEECTVPIEISTPSILTGNILIDPINLIASKRYVIPQLSTTLVTGDEEESSKSYLDKYGTFATSTTMAFSHHICSGKECLKANQCSSRSHSHVNGNEIKIHKPSELDLASVTIESKSCKKNITEKLFSNDCSLLLKDNVKSSSKRFIAKRDIHERKIRKFEQAVFQKSTSARTLVDIECKSQKKRVLKGEFFHLTKKTVKSNLRDSHLSIKKATLETFTLKNILSSQLSKRKKRGVNKVSSCSQLDSISKPAILRINCMPILHAHPETTEVTALQNSTSYMYELEEKLCLPNYTSPITQLSQILKRADETSSLQVLEEETKVCQNILPLFVEAFEKKQECLLEQILISRELLVEQNLWDNCKHKLKPCAIDTLVELQMVMETIQFIENKTRFLKGEPTFRSLLWYDETLYSELLGRPHGYQLQPNFYPAFQGRLKYNAFCELQNYHNELVKSFAGTKKENAYYAFLKYKRQINECEAIMKNNSDCFHFCLSVPFACGVNFGDSLGDLETLRKSILKLITTYEDSPKIHSYPGKKEHLWIIIEIISSKVNFIKINEEVNINISLYGLEHICFDAAKHLVWKEKSYSFLKNSQKKNKEMLVEMNKCAFLRLQKIYDSLARDLNSTQPSSTQREEDVSIPSRKSDDLVSIENHRLNSTLISHPDICCVGEILNEAEFADIKKLQELTLRCTERLEVFKKCFQKLQEDNMDNIFVTEENVLDVLGNHQHRAVILKPAAVETYIEVVMLSETVHFLKNSMAKKLDTQRFRGMLWFDLSLLPELIHCQEEMASFSFNDNPTCLWKVIWTAISELKKELDVIREYNEAVNCSYALHLISRELKELSEIKKLIKKSKYSISTYTDFMPYVASINYGNTVTELEYNYNQFSMLLKNLMSVPQKDLGKMAHVMKVMKTIKHMKIISAKNAKLSTYFILCQVLRNRRNTSQIKRKEKTNAHITNPEENSNKYSISVQVPSVSECIVKTISNSSKKRSITIDKWEDSQAKENAATISDCKKQKVTMKDITKINREKTMLKYPRTIGSHPSDEIKMGSSSRDDLKRNYLSPKMAERQTSLPGSPLPLENLQDTCMLNSESKIYLAHSSPDASAYLTPQQENVNSIRKRDVSFSAVEANDQKDCPSAAYLQKSEGSTVSKNPKTPSQRLRRSPPVHTQETCLSNTPETKHCVTPSASGLSVPAFHSVKAVHTDLEVSGTDLKHQDNKIVELSTNDNTGTNSPEPISIQDKIPVLQVNETPPIKTEALGKQAEYALDPSSAPFGSSESSTLDINQTTQYLLSEQDESLKILTQRADTCWNEPPQPAYTPVYHSEHQFGASYPYSAWCVYHYSSGSAITHTYQGITSYEGQPPPRMVTSIASTVQSTNSCLLYSEYFSYLAEQPHVNAFVPGNNYFPSQIPITCNFQQPVYSQFAYHQPLPQAAYPYPPNPGVLPEVPWIHAPWQQGPFPPRH